MHGTCETHLLDNSLAPVICSCYAAIVLERHVQRLALIWRLTACIASLHHLCTRSAASSSQPPSKILIRQAGQVRCDDGTICHHAFSQAVPQVQETMIGKLGIALLMQEPG